MASNISIAQVGTPATNVAASLPVVGNNLQNEKTWKEALDLYSKSSNSSYAKDLFRSTNPKDIRKYLEDVRQQQKKSKLSKTMYGIGTCIDALVRHERAMEMFAQAGGMPGCVAWGSIRLVLGLTQGHIKDYERLLEALADISAWLEPIGVDATTFSDSAMVSQSLVALYVHIIGFWAKAYTVYSSSKSRKLFGAFKAVWTDYDDEFNVLKQNMDKDLKIFLASANAEHHRQFDQFNKNFDKLVLESRRTVEHKDIVRWLAPGEDVPHGIDFYQMELTTAYNTRQPGTCEWILKQEKYLSWNAASPHNKGSFLWITAIPGAGKSILAAFVIFHHFAVGHKETFYFFFNNIDGYMTTALSAGKCLLYQLYMHARGAGETSHFDLQSAMESSGGSKAKSFEAVWDIVLKYAGRLACPVFIIDALDEVSEPDLFLNALLELVQKTSARVLLTSRPSAASSAADSKITFMEFGSEQRHDIETYIESRTTKGLTSLPQIRSTIVKTLVAKNDGMFLWVRLILEELESTHSIEEMELALKSLPTDLDGVYAKILKNLSNALKQSQKEFCHKILVWLFCACRPLSTEELYEAMKSEYAKEGFLYTAETISGAIRAACGPLVVFRVDSIRLVHFSLKEFLMKSPAEWSASQQELRDFHVDTRVGNLHIMKVCLDNLEGMTSTENFFLTDNGSSSINLKFYKVNDRWPLVEYTSLNWMNHALQSGPAELATLQALRAFIECKASVVWIYVSLVVDATYMEQLRWNIRSISTSLESRLGKDSQSLPHLDDIRTCNNWCNFVAKTISDYGSILEENPAILFDLDLQNLAQETNFRPNWISETARAINHCLALEQSFTTPRPTKDIPAHRQLHMNVSEMRGYTGFHEHDPAALGLFRIIKRYGAFIYASHYLSGKPQLLIQECSTGKRLAPITCDAEVEIEKVDRWKSGELVLLDSAISGDETRVALVYGATRNYSFFTCVWHLNKSVSFDSNPLEAQWAEVTFHTKTFQPIFDDSANLALFASNDLLWCPAGLVNMTTGSVTPYAMQMPDVPLKEDEEYPGLADARKTYGLALYGRGDAFLFSRERENGYLRFDMQRISSTGAKIEDIAPPADEKYDGQIMDRTIYCNLLNTDESGRFIVWMKRSGKNKGVVLHDTRDGKHATLKPYGGAGSIEETLFVNDSEMVVFATYSNNHLNLKISTWDVSSSDSGPSIIASRKYRENLCGMCVSADRETLYLVTTNRTITRLTLPNLEEREDYLGFRGQHREVIQTFPNANGTHIASVRSDQTRVDVKIWDIQQPSECQNYCYQPNSIISKSSEIVLCPNFEWIFFGDDGGYQAYSVTKEGLPLIYQPSYMVGSKAIAKAEQDSTVQEAMILNYQRSTCLFDHLHIADGRRYSDGHSHVYFSACGRYAVMAMDSSQERLNAHLILWSIDTKPQEQTHWDCIPITDAGKIDFQDAKISVNFNNFNPLCVLAFWIQPDSGIDRAICSVHCFVLDLKNAAVSHHLQPLTLFPKGHSITSFKPLAPRFNGSLSRAWLAQMDMMERSAVLSKCGQYLVLSATIGPERCQKIIDLPNMQDSKSGDENPRPTSQANPRVVEPKMTYWRQHRYWMSVYRQRILLNRSVRSVANIDTFSSLSCHVRLSVLPAHLADAKAWLLIPESSNAEMSVLVTTKDHPPELLKLKVSWNTVLGKLKGLEAEHEEAMTALDG
ncbi:hypothetical protein GP486_001681 [Trichoglossum hirsutum]|uniref:NACHT domain-containing protein n=1 Tax=Trichoglossum hirsutum TaxID=265104 RepID=A0A9P8LGD8_9PEZI|nr:hypothetical protein GP486_001681 [Trichoglossum hirsutum]